MFKKVPPSKWNIFIRIFIDFGHSIVIFLRVYFIFFPQIWNNFLYEWVSVLYVPLSILQLVLMMVLLNRQYLDLHKTCLSLLYIFCFSSRNFLIRRRVFILLYALCAFVIFSIKLLHLLFSPVMPVVCWLVRKC